jgi:hypothetical protein
MRERRDINLMVPSESRFGDVIMAAASGRIHYAQDDDFNDLRYCIITTRILPHDLAPSTING